MIDHHREIIQSSIYNMVLNVNQEAPVIDSSRHLPYTNIIIIVEEDAFHETKAFYCRCPAGCRITVPDAGRC